MNYYIGEQFKKIIEIHFQKKTFAWLWEIIRCYGTKRKKQNNDNFTLKTIIQINLQQQINLLAIKYLFTT